MRLFSLIVTAMLAAGVALAQQPGGDPKAPTVDEVLERWEKTMAGVQNLYAEKVKRTTIDRTFQTKEIFEGHAMYLKSNVPNQGSRAKLELNKVTTQGVNKEIYEKYICSGTFLYEFAPANKVIRVHEMPPPKQGQVSDDSLLSFLFGMRAVQAKQRYQVSWDTKLAYDQHYFYIQILPKNPEDKADFTQARLSLVRTTHLPAQVWFLQPNGNEVTWDFRNVHTNLEKLDPRYFEQPQLPKDWQFERVRADAKPKVRSANP
ncbi:MAG: TIGR03009 domain-containing protein [Gemmataceae bacterium]|nr:TIGR03009 domain-containing protein [Gemmataceae bacterium]